MNTLDFILLGVIASALIIAVCVCVSNHKNGKGISGCCGDCSSCAGCGKVNVI